MKYLESTVLLAKGKEYLKMLESDFDSYLQVGAFDMAQRLHEKYFGAAFMLHVLGLLSSAECEAQIFSLLTRYMDASRFKPSSAKAPEHPQT